MLWAITTYYNPCRYKRRRFTYNVFVAALKRQGVPLLTIECAFDDKPFELEARPDVLQIRASSVLWQKERLLNLAASYLPKEVTSVAWLDCDVVFKNDSWAVDTDALLADYKVIQPWTTCTRLDKLGEDINDRVTSFAAIAPGRQDTLDSGRYDQHGHTGYAWAMQRELFDKVGLYEHAVTGSADHFMAHAIYGSYGFCIENALKKEYYQLKHLKEWGARFYHEVRGSLAALPGEIEHIWHGDLVNRRYFLRMHDVTDLGYNPYTDVLAMPGRPLEWAHHDKPALEQYFINYFKSRAEDGAELLP